jgi:hypothetical protein
MRRLDQIRTFLAGLALFAVATAQAAVISFSPPTQTVGLGGSGSVDIVVSGRGGDDIGAFAFKVLFDPSIISATSVTFGSELGDPILDAISSADVSVPGTADVAEVSFLLDADLLSLQTTDSFVLATVNFDAIGLGLTALTFSGVELSDGNANLLTGVVAGTGSVRVVPEPGSLALVAVCLGAAGLPGRLRQRRIRASS